MSDHTPNLPRKRCPACGNEFPATTEYFHRAKNRPLGLYNYCKKCATARTVKWEHEHPELNRERRKVYRRNHIEKRRAYAREWQRGHSKQQYRNNIDKFRAKRKAQYQKESSKAKVAARQWYFQNKERAIANAKIGVLKRRARRHFLPDRFTKADWQNALTYFDHRCAICGRPSGLWHTLAMDHWIPLSDPNCPGTIPENIIPLCHGVDGCNNSKGDSDPVQWVIEKFGAKKGRKILENIQAYIDEVKRK